MTAGSRSPWLCKTALTSGLVAVKNSRPPLRAVLRASKANDRAPELSMNGTSVKSTANPWRIQQETIDGATYTVNRNEGMAMLGGAALDNEECYLLSKFARAMGVGYLEHQARI